MRRPATDHARCAAPSAFHRCQIARSRGLLPLRHICWVEWRRPHCSVHRSMFATGTAFPYLSYVTDSRVLRLCQTGCRFSHMVPQVMRLPRHLHSFIELTACARWACRVPAERPPCSPTRTESASAPASVGAGWTECLTSIQGLRSDIVSAMHLLVLRPAARLR